MDRWEGALGYYNQVKRIRKFQPRKTTQAKTKGQGSIKHQAWLGTPQLEHQVQWGNSYSKDQKVHPWGSEIPEEFISHKLFFFPHLEEEMAAPPGFLPGKPHGQRSLVGHGPWSSRVGHDLVTEHACTWHPAQQRPQKALDERPLNE